MKFNSVTRLTPCVLIAVALWPSSADVAAQDSDSWRPLEGDRPDATESPIPVDAGRFQIESSFVTYSKTGSGADRFESWTFGETNLKYGLTPRSDLQLIFAPHVIERVGAGGARVEDSGFGDLQARLKVNLWGADEGKTAFALLPYVTMPSGSDVSGEVWEGGLVTPFAIEMSSRWSLGFQTEIARVDVDGEREWDYAFTAVSGFDLGRGCGMYTEYVGNVGDHPYRHYFSGGLTWDLAPFTRFDVGALVGLNEDSDDLTVFTGVTWKF